MKKLLDEFYVDLMKEDRSTTYNKLLTNFYNEKNRFISKIKSYFLLLEKNYGYQKKDRSLRDKEAEYIENITYYDKIYHKQNNYK